MPIEDLDLPRRAFNSLKRHGITKVEQLRQTPDEELLRMRNFGKKSLDEVKERLAARVLIKAPEPNSDRALTMGGQSRSRAVGKEAARLAKRRWAHKVYRDDPRLAAELRALVPGAIDAMAAAELLPAMSFDPAGARRKAEEIRRFVAHGDELARRSLEEELDDFLRSATRNERAQQALRRRLGWDGQQPSTLDVAAREMDVTRERVRQIESKFSKAMQRTRAWTPALDKTLRLLNRLTLRAADEVQRELRDARLITTNFSVTSIVGAAEVFGRDVPSLEEHQGMLVAAGFVKTAGEVQLRGRRLADRSGATTVAELAGVLAEHSTAVTEAEVRVSLEMLAGLRWLDDEHNWFYVRGSRRNRVLNAVEKILSVAGSIALSELRDGVGRVDRTRPPRAVLARLCADTGLYRIESDRVVGTEQLPDWRSVLAPNERELADVLFEHGPVMRRSELERIAVEERGMNRNSFYIYLTYSPVLQRYAPGVFGLRGAPVTAAQVNELIPPIVHSQVLRDHGWTTNGRIWIAYRLSQAAAASGVLAAPAALAPLLRGEFQLATRSREQIGTLVVEESRVWGLSPFYRRRGVEAGDYLLLTFNTKDRSAVVETGDDSLLLRYQAGE